MRKQNVGGSMSEKHAISLFNAAAAKRLAVNRKVVNDAAQKFALL